MKKAQSSIEFMITIGAMLVIFIAISLSIYAKISQETNEKREAEINELALNIQNEIKVASGANDGYIRTFTIPNKIIGLDYDITITEGLIYIKTADDRHALAVPVQEVTGNIQIGDNSIRKSGTIIYLNG